MDTQLITLFETIIDISNSYKCKYIKAQQEKNYDDMLIYFNVFGKLHILTIMNQINETLKNANFNNNAYNVTLFFDSYYNCEKDKFIGIFDYFNKLDKLQMDSKKINELLEKQIYDKSICFYAEHWTRNKTQYYFTTHAYGRNFLGGINSLTNNEISIVKNMLNTYITNLNSNLNLQICMIS